MPKLAESAQRELEAREEELISRLDSLERNFPSDGWYGAADAGVNHISEINRVEEQLLEIHRQLGRHRPDVERYWRTELCVCGQKV